MKGLLILLLAAAAANVPQDYYCDPALNFILGVEYDQISLTEGCTDEDVCNNNPVYVPDFATNTSTDAAVAFCKTRCSSAALFYEFSGRGDPADACSTCTGFFFQRHSNGHEICGFYTADLNDASLDKVAHGHNEGSRLCVKGKLTVTVAESAFDDVVRGNTSACENPEQAQVLVQSFTEDLGFPGCGANMIRTDSYEDAAGSSYGSASSYGSSCNENGEAVITFRYDISDIPGNWTNSGEIVGEMDEWFEDRGLTVQNPEEEEEEDDSYSYSYEARRLSGSSRNKVGMIGTCMNHVCPDDAPALDAPPAYCAGPCCADAECCDGGATTCGDVWTSNDSGSDVSHDSHDSHSNSNDASDVSHDSHDSHSNSNDADDDTVIDPAGAAQLSLSAVVLVGVMVATML